VTDAAIWKELGRLFFEEGRAVARAWWFRLSAKRRERMIVPYIQLFYPLGSKESDRDRAMVCCLLAAMSGKEGA